MAGMVEGSRNLEVVVHQARWGRQRMVRTAEELLQ